MKKKIRFCEFTGDKNHVWDEENYKNLCQYAGFSYCTLHKKPLGEYNGYRVCCKGCTTPVQVKECCKE